MAQFSDLDHAFEGMSIQEVPITPTLERISTDHIVGKIVRERSYPSSSPKFLIGVDEDSAANNNWDQYTSSHSTSPTFNWEVEHINPPTDRVLVVMDYPPIQTFFHHQRSLTMSRYYAASVMESPHLSLLDSLLSSSLRPPFFYKASQSNLFDAFFIPNSQSPETPILGPAFNELPLAFTVHYPIFEECDNDDLGSAYWARKNFVCWPVLDSNWCQWTERMFTMKNDHLVKVGLKDLICLLRNTGNAKRRFMPQEFTTNPSTTLKFTQWWHNSMAVYNGTSLAKKFLKHINALSPTPKNIAPEDSQTISDDGFGKFDQSDGEKEVEQPMLVASIPLQSVPPFTTFRRKKHTRTLVSISEEPSKTLSSPKKRKALILDSDEDTVSYLGTGRMTRSKQVNPSNEVPIVEPIIEENPDVMVDSNQIENLENSPDPLNLDASNVENPVNSPLAVSETPLPESLETPIPQEFDKSVHAPTEISPPPVDISTPKADVQLAMEESVPLETHLSEATAHMVKEKTIPSKDATLVLNLNDSDSSHIASSSTDYFNVPAFSSKVKAFCDRICLPVQPPIVLSPMDELIVLLDPPASCLKSTFSKEEAQELIEIHQGFATLDFSFLIEHQMVEKDKENLHSQAISTRNSYREGTLKLQSLRAQEEALLKSLADIRQKISESTSELVTFEQQAKDQCEAIKLASPQFARSSGQRRIFIDACSKHNNILSVCKTVIVQLLNSS
ncbi:hypothetical protein RHGRI_001728 [Rhododendron griersonianum]|uniref:Aminotransferase-like plant mobile domain-containing protein n=1 Tax=Rhododendron griersonianum TaxID=479676 RepID=A0AAV6LNG3_9ERIC|nr:hypothetical protein RHGRI_001728 [Rhododendron griersonianum]